MMKLYFATAIALCLWLFSLPGTAAVVWDSESYEGPRPIGIGPVVDKRFKITKDGIIWCRPSACPEDFAPTPDVEMDVPQSAYMWADWIRGGKS